MNDTNAPLTAVTLSLADLKADTTPFEKLEEAFGPQSLGILIIKDLPPNFAILRQKFLTYASYLANLPPHILETLTSSSSNHLVGWSHGIEKLKSKRPDTCKGSYYFNCAFYQSPALQAAVTDPSTKGSFPEYTTPNIWPAESLLPGFKQTAEALCTIIIDTAVLVARACDRYAVAHVEGYQAGYLEHVVRTSTTTKARLLHYFPPPPPPPLSPPPSISPSSTTIPLPDEADSWCATHVDHGCLTGLTSALFVAEPPPPLSPSPSLLSSRPPTTPPPEDSLAGLYIHSRTGHPTKIVIPPTSLAFQTGEALEVMTRGKFRAVPHYVRGPTAVAAGGGGGGGGASDGGGRPTGVARNTLAVFTQPNLDEVVDPETGMKFGEWARKIGERFS